MRLANLPRWQLAFPWQIRRGRCEGAAGFRDQVDNHWGRIFSDAYRDYTWTGVQTNWGQAFFNALLFLLLGLILGATIKSTVYAVHSNAFGPGLIVRATLLLITSLLLISWFDYCIFPGLPVSLAGGKIEKVMLLAEKSHRSAFEELRIPLNPSTSRPNLTDVVGLIYETEHGLSDSAS
jgi:hypothetical protein